MGLSEDLKKVGETITTGEAKSLTLEGLKNEFTHEGQDITYEIKIGKFGPYILSSLKDESGKDVMRSIPPTLFPGTFTDSDAEGLLFPVEDEGVVLFGKYSLKKGRYGDYFERLSDNVKVTCPKALKNPGSAGEDYIDLLFSLPRTIGCDREGNEAVLKVGPYGFYAQYDGKNIKVTDPFNVNLDEIIGHGDVNMVKGEYNGKPISLESGRYGLYIKYGDENVRIPKEYKKESEFTLDKLIEIVSASGENKSSVKGEKEFEEIDGVKPLLVNGKYGYYIKWGKENVALSKDEKENVSSLTDERVKELIEEYKAKPHTEKKKFVRRKKA